MCCISGQNVLSTWIRSDNATNTISGTSMTSPHTTSLLAYFLSPYPSKSFNPDISALVPPTIVQSVPQCALETIAPVPLLTLTPAQLKKVFLELATPIHPRTEPKFEWIAMCEPISVRKGRHLCYQNQTEHFVLSIA